LTSRTVHLRSGAVERRPLSTHAARVLQVAPRAHGPVCQRGQAGDAVQKTSFLETSAVWSEAGLGTSKQRRRAV